MNWARLVVYSLILVCVSASAAQAEVSNAHKTLLASTLPHSIAPAVQATLDSIEATVVNGTAMTGEGELTAGTSFREDVELTTDAKSWCEFKGPDNTIIRVWQNTTATINWKNRTVHVEQGSVIIRLAHGKVAKAIVVSVPEGTAYVDHGTVRITKTHYGARISSLDGEDLLGS